MLPAYHVFVQFQGIIYPPMIFGVLSNLVNASLHYLFMNIYGLTTEWVLRSGTSWVHINGLMQSRRNSSALAMELRLVCIKQSTYFYSELCYY